MTQKSQALKVNIVLRPTITILHNILDAKIKEKGLAAIAGLINNADLNKKYNTSNKSRIKPQSEIK